VRRQARGFLLVVLRERIERFAQLVQRSQVLGTVLVPGVGGDGRFGVKLLLHALHVVVEQPILVLGRRESFGRFIGGQRGQIKFAGIAGTL